MTIDDSVGAYEYMKTTDIIGGKCIGYLKTLLYHWLSKYISTSVVEGISAIEIFYYIKLISNADGPME